VADQGYVIRTASLSAATGAPLVLRLLQALIRRNIDSGALSPGSMIPPERRLVKSYGLNIGTVKKAILNLTGVGRHLISAIR
jgi:DNA-binding GntR family transcriptional regulator